MLSPPGQVVIAMETDLEAARHAAPDRTHAVRTLRCRARPAAGCTARTSGRRRSPAARARRTRRRRRPCTSGTPAAIATGNSDNLLERAADVVIKEQRKPRLSCTARCRSGPSTSSHMLKLARLGVVIMRRIQVLRPPAEDRRPGHFVVARTSSTTSASSTGSCCAGRKTGLRTRTEKKPTSQRSRCHGTDMYSYGDKIPDPSPR